MKKLVKLLLLIACALGIGYLAYFGAGKDKYGSAEDIKLGLDLNGGLSITFQTVVDHPSQQDMDDTIYKLQKRVEVYSTEASVYQEGENRINVEIPLKTTDMESAKKILDDLGTPGTLYFITEKDSDGKYNFEYSASTGTFVLKKELDVILKDGSLVATGNNVKSAEAKVQESQTGIRSYVVALDFDAEGTTAFATATTKAAANKDKIGIYYDGQFVSAPAVQTAITDGSCVIEGQSSYEEANNLATYIRIGAVPLELKTLRSTIVAPQLGTNAIKTSLIAAAIGILLIILFMCAMYRVPGFAASIALLIYVGLVIFAISSFEVTLTLPGIAGIVLSIGMAVDANVIIFARIREELGAGNSVAGSIANGFNKAFGAIFDGNITTLIAAAVLYGLGSGTIKGFAATLAIGIILSMFTALVVTKFIVNLFYDLGIKNPKFYGVQKPRKVIDFVGKRKIFYVVSIVCILLGPVFMGINAGSDKGVFNFGIEFAGGSATTVTFKEDLSQTVLEEEVGAIFTEVMGSGTVQVQRVEGSHEVVFKTRELTADESAKISDKLVEKYSVDAKQITSDNISSTVSNEMQRDAVVAVVIATIAMLLYIWIRFSNIRFATSAIMALLHDVLVVLAFYAISRITVGNTFIACMLTIVGYSINATIVIFDRIRENIKNKVSMKETLEEIVNRSITETLTRSIYTSITTFVMLFMLFILGVTSIREFALPLMVGVICGAYSSVCITGALWYGFMKKFPVRED